MKLRTLSIAILSVTALTACGASGSGVYYTSGKAGPTGQLRAHTPRSATETDMRVYHTTDKGWVTGHMVRPKDGTD